MKALFFLHCFFLSAIVAAQTPNILYGVSWASGSQDCGMLYRFDANTNQVTVVWNFDTTSVCSAGNIMRASNGKLYGVSNAIFSYDLATNQSAVLHVLDSVDSFYGIRSDLAEGSNEVLYGLTTHGGLNNRGVIFSYDINTTQYSELYHFTDASWFHSCLMIASDGMLYGYATDTPDSKIFRFNPVNNQFDFVFTFDSLAGYSEGAFVEADNGLLYNTTGGWQLSNNCIYSFNRTTLQRNVVANVSGGAPLIKAANGTLYGMGGNCIYSFDVATNQLTTLDTFNSYEGNAEANLVESANGNFYSVLTSPGGSSYPGEIYGYNSGTGQLDSLFSFANLQDYHWFGRFFDGLIEVPDPPRGNEVDDFEVYPNPVNGVLSVTWFNNLYSLKLYDVLGKEVYSHLINDDDKFRTLKIDLSNQPDGIYFLALSDGIKTSGKKVMLLK